MSRDARPMVLAALVAGFCVWRFSLPVLVLPLAALAFLTVRHPSFPVLGRPVARQALRFAVFFGLIKFGLDCLAPEPDYAAALTRAALLAARLLTAVGIGLVLLLWCGTRALCLALSWYARPFLGKRAWRAALAAALVVHFLPMVFALADQTGRQIRLRLPQAGPLRRTSLLARAVLRLLAQKSWNQSVALIARDLDHADAWTQNGPPRPLPMLGAILTGAICVCLTFVS